MTFSKMLILAEKRHTNTDVSLFLFCFRQKKPFFQDDMLVSESFQ